MISWTNEKRKIKDLIPAEYNPRQATEKDIHDLTASLDQFNLADPIVINKNNTVIGGHFRLRILQQKGIQEIDVRVPDRELTPDEERRLNLRLNKNNGQWDLDALANFDEDMLKDIGWDPAELDKIFQIDMDRKEAADYAPAIRETTIKRGDIIQLGRHRLMCGDATAPQDMEKLMGGGNG
jgi:ParB-like chromosome segregation protein Spo0J